eukprot:s1844_g2.t1
MSRTILEITQILMWMMLKLVTLQVQSVRIWSSFMPRKMARFDDAGDAGGEQFGYGSRGDMAEGELPASSTLLNDSPLGETLQKVPRLSPEGSPSSGALYAPHFAGSVRNIQFGATDDDSDCREQETMDYVQDDDVELSGDGLEDEFLDEGNPPVMSAHDLEKLDIEAGYTEIQRLLN